MKASAQGLATVETGREAGRCDTFIIADRLAVSALYDRFTGVRMIRDQFFEARNPVFSLSSPSIVSFETHQYIRGMRSLLATKGLTTLISHLPSLMPNHVALSLRLS